jgi:hypothetical protein
MDIQEYALREYGPAEGNELCGAYGRVLAGLSGKV